MRFTKSLVAGLVCVLGLCAMPNVVRAAEQAERERIVEQIKDLEVKAGLLVKERQYERAEAIRREIQELQAKVTGRPQAERESSASPERRLQHLRVAVENLRLAGMNEAAERLGQECRRMEQELRQQAAQRQGPEAQIAELREQVQALRREVAELRETVKRLLDKSK